MSATKTTPVFYQWQRAHGYPVFLRVHRELHEGRLQKLVTDLGFQEIPEADHRKVNLSKAGTKILTLSRASTRVAQQVMTPDSLDKFGSEVLNYRGEAQVYMYRRLGMMVFSQGTAMWELGLVSTLETTEDFTSKVLPPSSYSKRCCITIISLSPFSKDHLPSSIICNILAGVAF